MDSLSALHGLGNRRTERNAFEESKTRESGMGITSGEQLIVTRGKLHAPIYKVHTVAGRNDFARDPSVVVLGPACTVSEHDRQVC